MRACPTSYSARTSSDVGSAPVPSPSGSKPSSPSPEELREAEAVAAEVEREFLASKLGEEAAPEAAPPAPPAEVEMSAVEEDLHLSSDSDSEADLSDVELPEFGGKSTSEPRPKDPPPGEGWFDMCGGEEQTLKRSASGMVSDPGDQRSGAPIPSPRNKKSKSDT